MSLRDELCHLGICCFTQALPLVSNWNKFPKGYNGIFIEYDKDAIEQYFLRKFALGDCFKKVIYSKNPLDLQSSSELNYDVLWEEDDDCKIYKSLRGDIEIDERLTDEFILRLLTRINSKFSQQNELRIILPYKMISRGENTVKGYEISIPKECILRIYVQKSTPRDFIKKLEQVAPDIVIEEY